MFKRKTEKQRQRERKRELSRISRQIGRNRDRLTNEENIIKSKIKTAASKNDIKSVKQLAKQIVMIRKSKEKLLSMELESKGLDIQMTTIGATNDMVKTMSSITKTLDNFNSKINVRDINHVTERYSRENEKLKFKEEMVSETLDTLFESGSEEEDIVNSVLDEIGLDIRNQLENPSKKVIQKEVEEKEKEKIDNIYNRLNNL